MIVRNESQRQIRILDSSYNLAACKSVTTHTVSHNDDLNHMSYIGTDYELPGR